MFTLYLIHLARPFHGHSQHYLGYTRLPLVARLERHATGNGARLLALARAEGIGYAVVAAWYLRRRGQALRRERRLKAEGHLARWCYLCREGWLRRRREAYRGRGNGS